VIAAVDSANEKVPIYYQTVGEFSQRRSEPFRLLQLFWI